jgi:hypothetical protein
MRKDRYDFLKENIHLLDIDLENGIIKNRTSNTIDYKGYKRIKLREKTYRIHEIIVVAGGLNPVNLTVNHKDCNKLNNQFSNLEVVTNKENINHAWNNDLIPHLKGELNGMTKLNIETVKDIKLMLNNRISVIEIANKFNIPRSTIYNIKDNRCWAHVTI